MLQQQQRVQQQKCASAKDTVCSSKCVQSIFEMLDSKHDYERLSFEMLGSDMVGFEVVICDVVGICVYTLHMLDFLIFDFMH